MSDHLDAIGIDEAIREDVLRAHIEFAGVGDAASPNSASLTQVRQWLRRC